MTMNHIRCVILPLTDAVCGVMSSTQEISGWGISFLSHSRLMETTSSLRSTCDGTNDSYLAALDEYRLHCYRLSTVP